MEQQPFFSIVIPTYNRPEPLTTCLQFLTRIEYPRDRFEVIVVDDGSEVPLEPVIASFHDQLDIALIKQPNAGPAAARNTGAKQAKGKFLAFTDDDCMPAPDWLQALEKRLATVPDRIVGGQTINALTDNLFSTTSQIIISVGYAHCNADPDRASFFTSNNLAVPADLFRALGGFDVSFTTSEDREFCDRWLRYGYQMTYAPEVQIYHAHKMTLGSFWRQQFSYGRGAFRFHQARAQKGVGQLKVEGNYYLKLLSYPLIQRQKQGLLLVTLLILSQVAYTAGFFWEKAKSNRSKAHLEMKSES